MVPILRIFVLLGLIFATQAQAETATGQAEIVTSRCTSHGGVVQVREATYGTNGNTPLRLSANESFCKFTSKSDGTSISVLLDTLNTAHPTLAALAYYAEVAETGSCTGSPGSCYCTQVGGTDLFGGINAAGGAWVLKGDSTDQLDACVFPDLSVIDTYGLFYHSANIIRGKNLRGVLAYADPYKK